MIGGNLGAAVQMLKVMNQQGGGQSWDATANYISALSVLTTSGTEQTITATIVGTDYTGVSFEYSTDNINFVEHGISPNGIYNAIGLISDTIYYWKARLYKGSEYGSYCAWDYEKTSPHANLIAGLRFNELVSMDGVSPAAMQYNNTESGIYYNGNTYVVYQGNSRDPYIFTYNHATGVFSTPVKIGTNPIDNGDYNHGSPGMLIDDDGYIHVMYGCHNSNIQYSKSNNPEDISAWTAQPTLGTGTYTQLIKFSNGDIYVFYRVLYNTCDWGYRKSTDNGVNWDAYVSLLVDYSYPKFVKGVGDIVHVSLVGNNTTDIERFNLYYFTFDGTVLKNINGIVLTTPIDITDAASILVKDSGANYIPASTLKVDAFDNPFIFFSEGILPSGTATYNYKIAKHNGTSWDIILTGCLIDAYAYASAIDVIDSNNIDIYPVTKTGNIEHWQSVDGGNTWTRISLLIYGNCFIPILVKDYVTEIKLIMQSISLDNIAFDKEQIYLWGNTGIINNAGGRKYFNESNRLYRGMVNGLVASVSGKYGKGIKISGGTGNNVVFADNDAFYFGGGSPDKPFSFTLWINLTNTNTAQQFIYKRGTLKHEYAFYVQANVLYLIMLKNDASAIIGVSVPFTTTNEWVFICGTYDGSGLNVGCKLYVNTTETLSSGDVPAYTGMGNYDLPVQMGVCASAIDRSLDEIKIWNKVLTPAEIAAEMAGTL